MNQRGVVERAVKLAMARHQKSIRVTEWAHKRLVAMCDRFQHEINTRPESYPGYAGRTITLSDTIVMMTERLTP